MQIIPHRKIFLSIAVLLVAASMGVLIIWGLPLGIDFTGGSLLEVKFLEGERPSNNDIRELLSESLVGDVLVQPTGDSSALLRFKNVDEPTHQAILISLAGKGAVEELRFESIGPVVGKELQRKAIKALIIVITLIIFYIAWAFRKVSRPVSSWKYGLAAILALIHDVAIPTGVVAVIGHFGSFQVDAFFITALLTILGFSVHDTIVVFDRIRENLRSNVGNEGFDDLANRSINEVMSRSINTSFTLLVVLLAVFFLGGATTKNLVFVLTIGVLSGTYSSLFIASPLLTLWAGGGKKD